jgi:hypothetical protein
MAFITLIVGLGLGIWLEKSQPAWYATATKFFK